MNNKDFNVIEEYVKLKLSVATAEARIQALKEDFYAACEKNKEKDRNIVNISESRLANDVMIQESKTAGTWKYTPAIREMDAHVKELKKEFQETHKPTGGNEPIWIVKILRDVTVGR